MTSQVVGVSEGIQTPLQGKSWERTFPISKLRATHSQCRGREFESLYWLIGATSLVVVDTAWLSVRSYLATATEHSVNPLGADPSLCIVRNCECDAMIE